MTTKPAAMSRVPSIPLNESMNATNSPPGPALWMTRPSGASALAALMTFFSTLTRSSPWTLTSPSLPISGTEMLAVVLFFVE